jgi:RNA polymerase sigma-70 factor (ECF subfamily)
MRERHPSDARPDERVRSSAMPDRPSDEALMVAYARGDASAFDELFARYEGRAYAFLLTRLRAPDRAADLFQELFLRVHRGRETFREDGRFDSWFFRVARNVLSDDLRRSGATLAPLDERLAARGDGPERRVQIGEALDAVGAALSEEERIILAAAKGAGEDLSSIAQRMGRTPAAVRQIVSRAIRRIRAKRSDVTGEDGEA